MCRDRVDTSKWEFVSLPVKSNIEPWSDLEISHTVADYMAMLRAELAAEPYSKTAHRTALLKLLPRRNAPAVEFKHSNISAVLHRLGLPYIQGYKPRGNVQAAPREAIVAYLAGSADLIKAVRGELDVPAAHPPDGSRVRIADIEEKP